MQCMVSEALKARCLEQILQINSTVGEKNYFFPGLHELQFYNITQNFNNLAFIKHLYH